MAPVPRDRATATPPRRSATRYLEIDTPDEPREPGRWLWHELEGLAVRSATGEDLGRIVELYRAGGAEVFVVRGPARRARRARRPRIVLDLAPERGEMIVDLEALALDARPVERRLRPAARPPAAEPAPDRAVRRADRRPSPSPDAADPPDADRRPTATPPADRSRSTSSRCSRRWSRARCGESIPARIQERGLATVRVHDLRQWGLGRHRTVDDYTYGGGAGMVLRPEPVAAALAALRRPGLDRHPARPGGRGLPPVDRPRARRRRSHLVFLCPRYEGVDERIRAMVDREVSIGDYVLTGGELAALVVIDAVLRLLPGAIDEASTAEESFAAGLLEYPQYTRPATFEGASVPPILVSGHHEQVRRWRLRESLRRTLDRRPDLLEGRPLTHGGATPARRGPPGRDGAGDDDPDRRPDTRHGRRAILRRRPRRLRPPPGTRAPRSRGCRRTDKDRTP